MYCVTYTLFSRANVSHEWELKRTILHFLEIMVGGCACRPKRVENLFPQTVAHIGMKREEVNHKREKGGRL